jgi:hypothetical protein
MRIRNTALHYQLPLISFYYRFQEQYGSCRLHSLATPRTTTTHPPGASARRRMRRSPRPTSASWPSTRPLLLPGSASSHLWEGEGDLVGLAEGFPGTRLSMRTPAKVGHVLKEISFIIYYYLVIYRYIEYRYTILYNTGNR